MKKVIEMYSGAYYKIESLATARNCYFENEEELLRCKAFMKRYLEKYVEFHKMYFSSAGYQILLKVRGADLVRNLYKKQCIKKGKIPRADFVKEPWRIISEQFRIFHSVYAKWLNKSRNRSGGVVKERYSRYYFESELEFQYYINGMENKKEIFSQNNRKYRVSPRWKRAIRWSVVRGVEWVESLTDRAFRNDVVSNLISFTKILHSTPKNHHPPP